jgi:hypothetical protein
MRQVGNLDWNPATRGVPAWRLTDSTYEAPYLARLGKISREEAVSLIARHNGDHYAITAELFSRRARSQK